MRRMRSASQRPLTQRGLGGRRRHPRVHDRGEERYGAHDGVFRLAERHGLIRQRPQGGRGVLQVRVLYGQAEKVQDAFVLRSGAHVLRHFVPVVSVDLQGLKRAAAGARSSENGHKSWSVKDKVKYLIQTNDHGLTSNNKSVSCSVHSRPALAPLVWKMPPDWTFKSTRNDLYWILYLDKNCQDTWAEFEFKDTVVRLKPTVCIVIVRP